MAGKVSGEMVRDRNGPHARATATVWDRERLMQVDVADVRPDRGRARESDLSVHIGAVHVHLRAVLVHNIADLDDGVFEDAVRGRVGHHQRA